MERAENRPERTAMLPQSSEGRVNYEELIKEMRDKERELLKRTETLENMMRTFTGNISNSNTDELTASPPPSFSFSPSPTQSTSVTHHLPHSTGIPQSYLRDAVELVPRYDGHNIPVWQFARACKRAKESVPLVDEALFVRMLRNKLMYHAYLAVEDEIHPTVDKFFDSLKRTFGSGRSSNYYRGQLSMAYKKQNEHILDYIGRIKDLKTAIIEGDQTHLNRPLSEVELASIESFALEAFYEGLPREYRTELRAEGYNTFTDACSKIIIINKRLEREEIRYKNNKGNAIPANPTRILRRDPSSAPSVSPNAPDVVGRKICSFCKNIGHLVHECRKRQNRESYNYNNNRFNNDSNSRSNRFNNYNQYDNNANYRLTNNDRFNNNNGNRFNINGNNNYNNNNNNTSNLPPRETGNRREGSANGAPRVLGKGLPAHCIGSTPSSSTSSETTEQFQPSSSNLRPSEDQLPLCSIQEHNLI